MQLSFMEFCAFVYYPDFAALVASRGSFRRCTATAPPSLFSITDYLQGSDGGDQYTEISFC